MEPATHVLAGACLARTGFHRRVAYATLAMAIAAEFPDIDTLWGLPGPIEGFAHHRGLTHTFIGIPFEAAFLLALFWLWHIWRSKRANAPQRVPPARWLALYGLLLLALLSHILLDYTNNYGVRPFFPFNPHWYAASIVWIFDPLLFLLLLLGLLLPQILRLVGQEQSGRKQQTGVLLPRVALSLVVVLWAVRYIEHRSALEIVAGQTLRPAPETTALAPPEDDPNAPAPPEVLGPLLQPRRTWASPDPLSIFRWYTVADFGPAYRLGVANTRQHSLSAGEVRQKATPSPAMQAALASPLGRVYMDWSKLPWLTQTPTPDTSAETTITFEDLRFAGGPAIMQRSSTPPLTGTVTLDSDDHILRQTMDNRTEPGGLP